MENKKLIFDRVREEIVTNKKLREEGKDIIIPFPFPKFRREVPGIMKGIYTIFSGNQKAGKSQACDYMYMYNPVNFIKDTNTNIDLKILYFSLEMAKEAKMRQAIVHRLFMTRKLILSTRQLRSLYEDDILSDDILRFIDSEREWFEFFEDKVDFIDSIKNPYGIYCKIRDFCHNNGKYINKNGEVIPLELIKQNKLEINMTISHFQWDNPDLFVLPIIDHISLVQPERDKETGKIQTLYDAVGKLSSNYLVSARNRWQVSPTVIQQQTLGKESNESAKMDRHEPSAEGLSDNKGTSKDCDQLITIYSPFRNKIKEYLGYDIKELKNYYRRIAVELDREGGSFETSVYFNGKINYFKELPRSAQMTSETYEKIRKEEVYP